jgi:hypothetical protein
MPTQQEHRPGCLGEQECPDHLGDPQQGSISELAIMLAHCLFERPDTHHFLQLRRQRQDEILNGIQQSIIFQ